MNETIINFINDIYPLGDIEKAKRTEDFLIMQIENFILWNWSDNKERERELKNLEIWIKEGEK